MKYLMNNLRLLDDEPLLNFRVDNYFLNLLDLLDEIRKPDSFK